jgi:hypothetical protein
MNGISDFRSKKNVPPAAEIVPSGETFPDRDLAAWIMIYSWRNNTLAKIATPTIKMTSGKAMPSPKKPEAPITRKSADQK